MRTRRTRSIMVAVRALDNSARPLLRKAAQLAKAHATTLRLLHVIALPYSPVVHARANIQQAARQEIEECRKKLSQLAAGRELRGIQTDVSVSWDYPAAEGITRAVLRHRPRMLVAESHRHGRFARVWLSNTDWDLIRNCPCPLWLSKSKRFAVNGKVIAAVDPLHAHAKPAALDTKILQHALDAAGDRRTRVIVCHSYTLPEPPVIDGAVEAYWIGMSAQEQREYEAMLRQAIDRLTRQHDIPEKNVLIVRGDPVFQLPRIAEKYGANVVVMGAVSRTGLRRIFVGHTAQRVIDELQCDVLIVKPRGFTTPVTRNAPPPMTFLPL